MSLWSSWTWGQKIHTGIFLTKIPGKKSYDFLQWYDNRDGDWQHGIDGCELVVTLEIRYNFAINAKEGNSEGQDFWLIYYTKPLHTVNKAFKCRWDIKFDEVS